MAGLSRDAIRRGLANPKAWHIHVFDDVPSTNTLALERAAAGAPERTVLLADSQTAGRGRAGREWRTPHGTALALSVIYRPCFGNELWPWIGLTAALAVRDAVQRVAGISSAVKWPNDVLIGGRKVAGILLETRLAASHAPDQAVVVGIGMNINNRSAALPEAFRESAISLLDASGAVTDRNDLAAATLNALNLGIEGLPDSIEILRDGWRAASATFGAMVAISTADGLVEGIDHGLDSLGRLMVRTREGERTVHTGDVLLCRTAAPLAN
jgi:BirA family biotin operon repressor/biotin-[acetyl-CoA-carboxylase] ligase